MIFSIGDGIIKEGPPGTPDRLTRKRANRTFPKILLFWAGASGALLSSIILVLTDNLDDFFYGLVVWVVAGVLVMSTLAVLTLFGNRIILSSWRFNVTGCLALSVLTLAYSIYLFASSMQHGGYKDSIAFPYLTAILLSVFAIVGNGLAFYLGMRTNWCIALANRDEEY